MVDALKDLGIEPKNSGVAIGGTFRPASGKETASVNPATAEPIASVRLATTADYQAVSAETHKAFLAWRSWPAPKRGNVIRQLAEALRRKKTTLGALVSMEMGKIRAEGEGEVQEMIDVCDFAVGLSRQLYGLSMHSERPGHRMLEQWHPLGTAGVITAFNFPVAVWAWNAAVGLVCGDAILWKPSSETPLTAIAVQKILGEVLAANNAPPVASLVIGPGRDVGEAMLNDPAIPLISLTGSCAVGQHAAQVVGQRFGRTILELGGNNGVIIMDDADTNLAARAVLFGAVGTAGQRCTSTRRLLLHRSIAGEMTEALKAAYRQVRIGDPLDPRTLMGPLVNAAAVDDMMKALDTAKSQGAELIFGGERIDRPGFFVQPALVKARHDMPIVQEETFAPILYLLEFDHFEDAIAQHNEVPQGLSSSIFTRDLQKAEAFLSERGSDCGIANVNIGTSGAEIGGAFGGEKATGGGRESGSDAWKQYMRRQTCTINWSSKLELAQGIRFGD
ncbi:MAG: aldehyde dehydrogenase family protein [Deltaproteobacteria bacterium]|nr:aldehyde dehydrogenase family protein [Deltaproteobacteria bacterium]